MRMEGGRSEKAVKRDWVRLIQQEIQLKKIIFHIVMLPDTKMS